MVLWPSKPRPSRGWAWRISSCEPAQILAKDKELLASLQAQKPGLEAIMVNARDYLDRFNRLAGTGDIPVQDRDNREANYREAVAKLKSLQSNIAAAERQVLASELQIRQAETRLEQSRKALANAEALVGRGQAAQLEPQVEEQSAIALENKVRQAEAKLRLARLSLSNTLIRADTGDRQPPDDSAWTDRGGTQTLPEHRTAGPRQRLGRG